MANRLLGSNAAQPVDHVVAGDATRLVDHKKPVHIITLSGLRRARHAGLGSWGRTCPQVRACQPRAEHSKLRIEMAEELERARKAVRELSRTLKRLPNDPPPGEVHKLRTTTRRVEAIVSVLPQ